MRQSVEDSGLRAGQDLMNLKTKTKGNKLIFTEGQAFNTHHFLYPLNNPMN